MDQDKLKRLREAYGDDDGSSFVTDQFKHLETKITTARPRGFKPYGGLPTFMDLPYQEDFDGLDVAVVGVPMDLGVTNRSGARFGPRAVRAIERVGPYSHALDEIPGEALKAADVGDVPMRSRFSVDKCHKDIVEYYRKLVAAGVKPLTVGGDHSITFPIMRALGEGLAEGESLAMLHIDAHMDIGAPIEGEKFHHGGPFRLAVLDGVLDPDHCVQIGIRGPVEIFTEFSYDAGMTVIHAEDVELQGIKATIEKAKAVLGNKPVYVTVDVDGIDPAYTPGTGTPEVGGLTPLQVQMIIRSLKGLNIIGGDVVEIAPQYDPTTNTAHVGAQMLFEIFSVMAFSPE